MKIKKIAIIGLGYVGLPLAINLSKYFCIFGFDISSLRVKQLRKGKDITNEIERKILLKSLQKNLSISNKENQLAECNIFIVTVPTPVTENNDPDFSPLLNACEILGRFIEKDATIVFESTVYPGATEEICGKKIEEVSGLKLEKDFFLGYSPERVNPGDKIHTIDKITKVISAENPKVVKLLQRIYSKLTSNNIFIAKNIKVAEASKVIENSQRDINIAFINEITKIALLLNISIYDVLEASSTKWNFLNFYPGLVGGHCIGVDPFYLATKAKELGVKPRVILAGRDINEKMSTFIGEQINKKLPSNSKILILGLSFKENVPDTRNSKIFDLIEFFKNKKHKLIICDPLVGKNETKTYDIKRNLNEIRPKSLDAIIFCVPHDELLKLSQEKFKRLLKDEALFADIKGVWRKKNIFKNYWSL